MEMMTPTTSNEHIAALTKELLELYQNPNIYDMFFSIMNDLSNQSARHYAAVYLRKIMSIQWKRIMEEDPSLVNSIMEQYVGILANESDDFVVDNVIHAIEMIFEEFGENWTSLFSMIMEIIQSKKNIATAMKILIKVLPYTNTSYLTENGPSLLDFTLDMLQSNQSSEADILCFKLFASCIYRDESPYPAYPPSVISIFELLISKFSTSLVTGNATIVAPLSVSLAQVVTIDQPFISPLNAFQHIFEIMENPRVHSSMKKHIFYPLSKIVKKFGNHIREYYSESLKFSLQYSSANYTDGLCFEDQEDACVIQKFVSNIASTMNSSEFLSMFVSTYSLDSEADAFSTLYVLYSVIKVIQHAVEEGSKDITDLLIQCLQTGSHILIEASCACLVEISKWTPGVIEVCVEEIVSPLLQCLGTDDTKQIKGVLDVLASILFETSVETSLTAIIVDRVLEFQNSISQIDGIVEITAMVVRVLSSAISCSKEDSIHFATPIIPFIIQNAENDDVYMALIRLNSIEALGLLIAYSPQSLGDNIERCFSIISSQMESDDSCMLEAVCRSMVTIIRMNPDLISFEAAQVCILFAIKIIDDNWQHLEEIEDKSSQDLVIEYIKGAFNLLQIILKKYSSLLVSKQDEEKQVSNMMMLMKKEFEDFSVADDITICIAATKLGVQLSITTESDICFERLQKHITEREEIEIVTEAFKGFRKLIKKKNPHVGKYNEHFLEYGYGALERKLYFQKENYTSDEDLYNYDIEFMPAIYDFLCDEILAFPSSIDPDRICLLLIDLYSKVSPHEICSMFCIFSAYSEARLEVPTEILEIGLKMFEYCDFSHDPNPIFFISCVIQNQPSIIKDSIVQIVDFMHSLILKESTKDRYYKETIANAASTLFHIYNTPELSYAVDIDTILPTIVSHIPYKGDFVEGNYIVQQVVLLFRTKSQLIAENRESLFRGFVRTLSFDESTFQKYHFNNDDVQRMKDFVNLCNRDPAYQEAIYQILDDEIKISTFTNRMS